MFFFRAQKGQDTKHSILFNSLIHKSENAREGKSGCPADAFPGTQQDKDTGIGAERTGELQSPSRSWQLLFKQLKGLKGKEGLK